MIFVSYDKCRSGKLFKPSCNSLHHTHLAEFHINAPADKRLFYLLHKLTSVDEKKHSLAVKGRPPSHFSNYAGLSSTAGQDYAGCFIPCTPSLPYLLHQLILIRSADNRRLDEELRQTALYEMRSEKGKGGEVQ